MKMKSFVAHLFEKKKKVIRIPVTGTMVWLETPIVITHKKPAALVLTSPATQTENTLSC